MQESGATTGVGLEQAAERMLERVRSSGYQTALLGCAAILLWTPAQALYALVRYGEVYAAADAAEPLPD